MIGLFKKENFEIVTKPEDADIIVVNTCGFIKQAKEEAINTLLEMAKYKEKNCKLLVATGCLVERYKDELKKSMPEVDAFIKFSSYDTFWEQIQNALKMKKIKNKKKGNDLKKNLEDKEYEKLDFNNRIISTGVNYAYIRIADGCDNFCTFCAIPYIRGRYKSRKEEDILEEAKKLASRGIREIIIIAQDTTKYGIDIYNKPMLADLLHKLSEIEGIEWIRFLYSYPETITNDLIDEVKSNDKICKYFDIPMQHISDKILKKMNRKSTKKSTMELITRLRKEIPNVIIRSTLMCGFPGESEEDFNELCEFVKWAKFDKLGCFKYSKEDNTLASKMDNQIHWKVKQKRYDKIMKIQQEISKENEKKYLNKTFKTLIEDAIVDENNNTFLVGRTYMDVPEIDGKVYIKANEDLLDKIELNTFVNCKIIGNKEYDLIGEIVF